MSATQDRIRDAAIELFALQGFAATGIRELADRVGITTSTLYHHYRGKDELLERIIITSMDALNEMAAHWSRRRDRCSQTALAGLIACHVMIHATNPREVVVVDRQLGFLDSDARRRAVAARDHYETAWRDLIVAGVGEGAFRVVDPALACRALLGATTAIADWYRPTGELAPAELADVFVTMSFDMLNAAHVPKTPQVHDALQIFDHRWEQP